MTLNFSKNPVDDVQKDIYIKELEQSYQKSYENDRTLSAFKNIVVFVSICSIIGSAAVSFFAENTIFNKNEPYSIFYKRWFILFISFSVYFVWCILICEIAKLQKQSILCKRKIVLLRELLNIDYSAYDVLPKNDISGAKNPFLIRYSQEIPASYRMILLISWCFNCLLLFYIYYLNNSMFGLYLAISIIQFLSLIILYKRGILERYESFYSIVGCMLSRILHVKIIETFENTIHSNLTALTEAKRLNLNLEDYYKILIAIEDKNFYKHKGIDIKRIFAIFIRCLIPNCALKSLSRFTKDKNNDLYKNIYKITQIKGGGSTITQQYFRSNFIIDFHKKYRRKILELYFSRFWINCFFDKQTQLNLYLVSVRFDKNVIGIISAHQYFFGKIIRYPTKSQIFVLLDRLSNVNSTILAENIFYKLESLFSIKLINQEDIISILCCYKNLISNNKIFDPTNDFLKLEEFCNRLIYKI